METLISSPAKSTDTLLRQPTGPGLLIVNADDWGRDTLTTDRIADCASIGAVSSVSAMVYMQDSERSARLAREQGIEAGLHLNFTTAFTAANVPARLLEQQSTVAKFLLFHRLSQLVYMPGLGRAFESLVAAQIEEFIRLYGAAPKKLDGHHHMHLSANVRLQKLLPAGSMVRRNFSFTSTQKSVWNRLYRKSIDRGLARRHRLTDYFFSLPPLESNRLEDIFSLASHAVVEMETHPTNADEYQYLRGGEFFRQAANLRIGPFSAMPPARIPPEACPC